MKEKLLLLIGIISTRLLFGQEMGLEDFNKDGFPDTLSVSRYGGSGFGGMDCKIVEGEHQKKFLYPPLFVIAILEIRY